MQPIYDYLRMIFLKKHVTKLLYICLTLPLGCIDVVDVEISKKGGGDLVVNAFFEVNNLSNKVVTLSRSVNYEGQFKEIKEGGAKVSVVRNDGFSITFFEISEGKYSPLLNSSIKIDTNYFLRIETEDGKLYESDFQKAPNPVCPDSIQFLTQEYLSDNGFRFFLSDPPKTIFPAITFIDRKGEENYYAWNIFKGSKLITDIFNMKLLDDSGIVDGAKLSFDLLWFNHVFLPNERVRFEQLTLNKGTFEYLTSLKNLTESSSPFSSPAYLSSNIKCLSNPNEKVLGFFSLSSACQLSKVYEP